MCSAPWATSSTCALFLWDGFAAQLRTVQEYYERSMQLLDPAIRSELLCAERPILAKEDDEAASYIAPDSRCVNSLIADGCQIEGDVEGASSSRASRSARGAKSKTASSLRIPWWRTA